MSEATPRVQFLRLPEVQHDSGVAKSTLYARIADGLFPRPVRIGPRSVAWPAHEIAAINRARLAGQSDRHIADLVSSLQAKRSK